MVPVKSKDNNEESKDGEDETTAAVDKDLFIQEDGQNEDEEEPDFE
jgi:hypothetical protein